MTTLIVHGYWEANCAVNKLCKEILDYNQITVIDAYDLIMQVDPSLETPALTHKDDTIGWDFRDIGQISVTYCIGGIGVIHFPEPHVLEL